MSLPSINFLQARQTFSFRPPAHLDTMGKNNTRTALKGCGVKISKNLAIIARIKCKLSFDILLKLYHMLIHQHLILDY